MEPRVPALGRALLLLAIVSSILGCPGKQGPDAGLEAQGRVDFGGGETLNSSRELVNRTLNMALKFAGEPDPLKNLYIQFLLEKGQVYSRGRLGLPLHLLPNVRQGWASGIPEAGELDSPPLMAISAKEIQRLESGDCLKSDGELNSDASVSSHTLDAKVCFSTGNLTEVGPSDLWVQISSLVLHETSHLGGANEEEAQAWQKNFAAYFAKRFGDTSTEGFLSNAGTSISIVRSEIRAAKEMIDRDPTDPAIYARMAKVVIELEKIPSWNDELGVQMKTMSEDPRLANEFVARILKLHDYTKANFLDFNSSAPRLSANPLALKSVATEIESLADGVANTFNSFQNDSSYEGEAECGFLLNACVRERFGI